MYPFSHHHNPTAYLLFFDSLPILFENTSCTKFKCDFFRTWRVNLSSKNKFKLALFQPLRIIRISQLGTMPVLTAQLKPDFRPSKCLGRCGSAPKTIPEVHSVTCLLKKSGKSRCDIWIENEKSKQGTFHYQIWNFFRSIHIEIDRMIENWEQFYLI